MQKLLSNIPKIKDTGSAGSQKELEGNLEISEKSENLFEKEPFRHAARGLSESTTPDFGDITGRTFVKATVNHLSNQIDELKQELTSTRSKLEIITSKYSNLKLDFAVLKVKLSSTLDAQHTKKALITLGTLLLGIGINTLIKEFYLLSGGIIALALVLLIWGWWPRGKEADT